MLTRQDVAAAAPVWARDALVASSDSTVVYAGADAIYLDVGSDVIAVITRQAVEVPCALQTTLTSMTELGTERRLPRPGTRIPITDGRIRFADHDVVIGRILDFRAPAIDPRLAAGMAARLEPWARPAIAPILPELPDEALELLRRADPRAVDGLIGLGSGLTPLGDDVMCGWLATLVAASHPCGGLLATAVRKTADTRTTKLSATLLRRAVAGDVVPQFTDLIRALNHAPNPSETNTQRIGAAVRALAEIGHTSGVGLTVGLSIALDHLATRSYCP